MYPEKQLANWTAIRYTSDHILDYIELDDGYAIFEVEIPREWVGRTVGDIDIRRKYNINILAVKRDGKLDVTVNPDTCFTDRDAMLVLGSNKDIHKCFRI